jgi:hypothetical protein
MVFTRPYIGWFSTFAVWDARVLRPPEAANASAVCEFFS